MKPVTTALTLIAATAMLFAILPNKLQAQVANPCQLEISGDDSTRYNKKSLTIKKKSCAKITLTLRHSGKMQEKAVGHNWVLVATAKLMPLVKESLAAGPDLDYLPRDKSSVIAFTKMLGGGESDTITFSTRSLKPAGDYTFVCTFPGHFGTMQGKFNVEE